MATTIRQSNIDFTNIKSDPIFMVNGKFSKSDHNDGTAHFDTTLTESDIAKSFNSIEIDWNGARLPNGDPSTGQQKVINTTGELMKQIDDMQKEIYVLSAMLIADLRSKNR